MIHQPGIFGKVLIESPGFYVNEAAVLDEADSFADWPQKIYLGVGTNEEGREDCDEDDFSSEAVKDVLRLETILKQSGLSAERLYLWIALCAEHNEQAYASRFPNAMRAFFMAQPRVVE